MYRMYGMSILQKQQIDDVQDVRYVDFAGATNRRCTGRTVCRFCRSKNRRHTYRRKSAFLEVPYTDRDIFAV